MYATNNVQFFYHEGYFTNFTTEGKRMMSVCYRDGVDGLTSFVLRTYISYRLVLRNRRGYANDKKFRRTYIQSCLDFRKFLKEHSYSFDENSPFIKAIRTIRQRSI